MKKFNPLDVLEIQECLYSYKLILNTLVTESPLDREMKEARESIVDYLMNKCEDVLKGE